MAGLQEFGSKSHLKHSRQGLSPFVALNPLRTAKHVKKSFRLATTATPQPIAPVVPLPDQEQIELDRKRNIRNQRGGRRSTILSDGLG